VKHERLTAVAGETACVGGTREVAATAALGVAHRIDAGVAATLARADCASGVEVAPVAGFPCAGVESTESRPAALPADAQVGAAPAVVGIGLEVDAGRRAAAAEGRETHSAIEKAILSLLLAGGDDAGPLETALASPGAGSVAAAAVGPGGVQVEAGPAAAAPEAGVQAARMAL
jgi:hypothetical protein